MTRKILVTHNMDVYADTVQKVSRLKVARLSIIFLVVLTFLKLISASIAVDVFNIVSLFLLMSLGTALLVMCNYDIKRNATFIEENYTYDPLEGEE